MAKLAVFASGNGSNFQVIAEAVKSTSHSLEFLLCNIRNAYVVERAKLLAITTYIVSYLQKERQEAEKQILQYTKAHKIDLIALAGYMKLLTPFFLSSFKGKILNLHPALLPKFPGVDAIERSFKAGEKELGISIIQIDAGVDTGPILFQTSFTRSKDLTLEQAEARIHELEHIHFPAVIIQELDKIDAYRRKQGKGGEA
jgi:phosphoribosylglycinamide formyltransferase-1